MRSNVAKVAAFARLMKAGNWRIDVADPEQPLSYDIANLPVASASKTAFTGSRPSSRPTRSPSFTLMPCWADDPADPRALPISRLPRARHVLAEEYPGGPGQGTLLCGAHGSGPMVARPGSPYQADANTGRR